MHERNRLYYKVLPSQIKSPTTLSSATDRGDTMFLLHRPQKLEPHRYDL